jgi:hypothetical protein
MHFEWENFALTRLMAYLGINDGWHGQGTPRDLGRAKFVITTQQVAIAGRLNS